MTDIFGYYIPIRSKNTGDSLNNPNISIQLLLIQNTIRKNCMNMILNELLNYEV